MSTQPFEPAPNSPDEVGEPWEEHYSTPPDCSPELDEYWDEAYYYGEY